MKKRTLFFTLLAGFGCLFLTSLTALATPAITGTFTLCVGSSTTLNDAGTGTWSSSAPGVAAIGAVTGLVTGVSAGTAVISFNAATGIVTQVVTVNGLPNAGSISGATSLCQGTTITLSDISTGGVWSSSAPTVGTVGVTGIVTGLAGGTTTISYTVSNTCATARATYIVTVNPLPVVPAITGIFDICIGSGTTLSDALSGGMWNSSNPAVATITAAGVVSSVSQGTTFISYADTNQCGTTTVTHLLSVDTLVTSLILTGSDTVCQTSSTAWVGTSPGGTWTSNNASIVSIGLTSGIATGVAVGSTTITYLFTNACGSKTATAIVSVQVLPYPGTISGHNVLCAADLTQLHDYDVPGGTWSSGSTAIATVMSNGYVTGVSGGTVTLSYIVTNDTSGCWKAATYVMTINALPSPVLVTSVNPLSTTLSYVAYNWMDDGVYIGGATAPTYFMLMAGAYSVRVTDLNGCSNNSATFNYPVTAVQNVNGTNISIYPNPTNGHVSIESANSTDVQITSIDGRLLLSLSDAKELDLKNYADGTYILSVFDHATGAKLITEKILKGGN
jgi:uncharacterized protein YjdB